MKWPSFGGVDDLLIRPAKPGLTLLCVPHAPDNPKTGACPIILEERCRKRGDGTVRKALDKSAEGTTENGNALRINVEHYK